MIKIIMKHINKETDILSKKYSKQTQTIGCQCNAEIHALLGLFILSGAQQYNLVTTVEMWSPEFGAFM